jgi:hypothetical protein
MLVGPGGELAGDEMGVDIDAQVGSELEGHGILFFMIVWVDPI